MTHTPAATSGAIWYSRYAPRPQARLRLFCFPYAGGGAAVYRPWVQALPEDIEVCGIVPPGRDARMREPGLTSVEQLVDQLLPALQPLLDRPFALFGHSLGALTAFETARRLREAGTTPTHLLVSARAAPQQPMSQTPISGLPAPMFIEQIRERYGGIPEAILREPELLQLFLPTLQADFTMLESYRYAPAAPLGCPIVAFGGLQDRITAQEIAQWREQTSADFQQHMLPGDHFFLQSHRGLLLDLIRSYLAE